MTDIAIATPDDDSNPEPQRSGTKSTPAKFKFDGLSEGEFYGYASVFGNKDSDGDIVVPGAYARTLAEWKSKGNPIPLLWGHVTSDPDFNVGEIVSAEEDDRGLKVHGRIDMESPKGPQTYRLLKSGRVNNMSFAYAVTKGAFSAEKSAYEIKDVDLFEVSIVPIGANALTEILAVKTATEALAKAGRALSAKNLAAINTAIEQAEAVVDALKSVLPSDDSSEQEEEDQDSTSGKEPSPGTVDTKSPGGTANPTPSVALALMNIEILEALKGAP